MVRRLHKAGHDAPGHIAALVFKDGGHNANNETGMFHARQADDGGVEFVGTYWPKVLGVGKAFAYTFKWVQIVADHVIVFRFTNAEAVYSITSEEHDAKMYRCHLIAGTVTKKADST